MFQIIRLEAPYMKFNPQPIKYWMMKSKKKYYTKDPKLKISIKKIRIKIEIKNKLEDNYKFLIKMWNWKENHFNKRTKKIKIMSTKLEKISYQNLD